MGFHTRGEMGGIWTPPIKLVDGIWFGIGERWIGPATRFTSGCGHVQHARCPAAAGCSVDAHGLRARRAPRRAGRPALRRARRRRTVKLACRRPLRADVRSTRGARRRRTPADVQPARHGARRRPRAGVPRARARRPRRTPSRTTGRRPSAAALGRPARAHRRRVPRPAGRGPADLPGLGARHADRARDRCDDTAYGKGAGGELRYEIDVPAGGATTVWFGVGRLRDRRPRRARAELARDARTTRRARCAPRSPRARGAARATRGSTCPATALLPQGIDWSKQNLADSVQEARDLELRETNAGTNYPPPKGARRPRPLRRRRLPGLPVAVRDRRRVHRLRRPSRSASSSRSRTHLRALRDVVARSSTATRQGRPRGDHRRRVYFGAERRRRQHGRDGQVPERRRARSGAGRATTRSATRCTTSRRRTWSTSSASSTRTATAGRRASATSSGPGMGEEKLDNTVVHDARAARPRRPGAQSKGDAATAEWAGAAPPNSRRRFEAAWWMPERPAARRLARRPGQRADPAAPLDRRRRRWRSS